MQNGQQQYNPNSVYDSAWGQREALVEDSSSPEHCSLANVERPLGQVENLPEQIPMGHSKMTLRGWALWTRLRKMSTRRAQLGALQLGWAMQIPSVECVKCAIPGMFFFLQVRRHYKSSSQKLANLCRIYIRRSRFCAKFQVQYVS